MTRPGGIERYALFGETGPIVPEFVHVETIAARSRLHDWNIRSHTHGDIVQLVLLERGGGTVSLDGRSAALVPPALVALPAGCVHGFVFDASAEGWVLSVAGAVLHDPRIAVFLDSPALGAGAAGRTATIAPESAGRLAQQHADIAAQPDSGTLAGSRAARIALLLALAVEALSSGSAPAERPTPHAALAARFRALVELHFREGWTVTRYAAELGTTEPTLTRACRAAIGVPPAAHIHARLLIEAMRLLTYSTASVAQVGAALGFDDPAYFARFFRNRTGMTAGAFRRQRAWLDPEVVQRWNSPSR